MSSAPWRGAARMGREVCALGANGLEYVGGLGRSGQAGETGVGLLLGLLGGLAGLDHVLVVHLLPLPDLLVRWTSYQKYDYRRTIEPWEWITRWSCTTRIRTRSSCRPCCTRLATPSGWRSSGVSPRTRSREPAALWTSA